MLCYDIDHKLIKLKSAHTRHINTYLPHHVDTIESFIRKLEMWEQLVKEGNLLEIKINYWRKLDIEEEQRA